MNAIIIVARLESERLPQKHLEIVEGLPLIKWLTKRIQFNFQKEINEGLKLILATPSTQLNKKFKDLYVNDSVELFEGHEKNIPLRIMECSDRFLLDKVVIADGDNFLLSMEAIKAVLQNLISGSFMVKTEGLPLGMNVMGWDKKYLESILNKQDYPLLETGWGRIFNTEDIKKIRFDFNSISEFDKLRFTTDYPEDLIFMQKVFHILGKDAIQASASEIIRVVINNKYYELNENLSRTYFENFYKKMNEEKEINHENI